MAENLTIGRVARAAGCKVQTVRYYEQIGLLPPAARTGGNQRIYGTAHMKRLAFIRHARELGFSLDAIRDLLSLADDPNQPCDAADAIATAQLAQVSRRLSQLQALKDELERMVARCQGGRIAECRVIEVLADHSHAHCLNDDHAAPAKTGS
jgi:Cu(I)-responsive transcriptional regulator